MTEEAAANVTPDVGALAEQVRRVAALRRSVSALAQEYNAKQGAFAEAHTDLRAQIAVADADLDAAEAVVRALALAHYAATQDRAPTPGVAVKIYDTQIIGDEAAALAWAKSTGIGLVPETVDTKALLKVAKATRLPFVAYNSEARVQISADLDKALDLAPVSA